MNPPTLYRRAGEYRAVMAAAVAVCGLGFACSLVPAVEHATTRVLLSLGLLAAVAVGVRLVGRWVRERGEDRADLTAGAVWRAQHMPAHRGCVEAGEGR